MACSRTFLSKWQQQAETIDIVLKEIWIDRADTQAKRGDILFLN